MSHVSLYLKMKIKNRKTKNLTRNPTCTRVFNYSWSIPGVESWFIRYLGGADWPRPLLPSQLLLSLPLCQILEGAVMKPQVFYSHLNRTVAKKEET